MTGFARSVTSLQVHASATARLRRHVRILRQDRCLRGIHAFYAHLVAALQGSTCWRSKAIAQTGGPQCDCCRSTTTLELPRPGNGQAWRCGQYIATAHRRPGRSVRGAAVRHRPGSRRAAGAGTRQHHMCVRCPVHPPSVRHRARHRCVRRLSRQSGSCGFAESRCRLLLGDLGAPWLGCHARTVVTGQRAGFFSSVLVQDSEAMPRRLRRMLLHPTFKTLKTRPRYTRPGLSSTKGSVAALMPPHRPCTHPPGYRHTSRSCRRRHCPRGPPAASTSAA